MLLPPRQPTKADEAPKRSEAVFRTDDLRDRPQGWVRVITFWFEGEEYQYTLEAVPNMGLPQYAQGGQLPPRMTEGEARRRLYGPNVETELRAVFLREVTLDMTRPH